MIPNPWLLVGAAAVLVLVGGVGYLHGIETEQGRQAVLQQAAVAEVRAIERTRRDIAAKIIQEQLNESNRINTILAADLDRLRNRPDRVPRDPAACAGSDGTSLSAEDGGFLVREAARADQLRSALDGCYAWADSLRGR